MAFTPKVWKNLPSQETPITAEELNRIETGIAGLSIDLTDIESRVGVAAWEFQGEERWSYQEGGQTIMGGAFRAIGSEVEIEVSLGSLANSTYGGYGLFLSFGVPPGGVGVDPSSYQWEPHPMNKVVKPVVSADQPYDGVTDFQTRFFGIVTPNQVNVDFNSKQSFSGLVPGQQYWWELRGGGVSYYRTLSWAAPKTQFHARWDPDPATSGILWVVASGASQDNRRLYKIGTGRYMHKTLFGYSDDFEVLATIDLPTGGDDFEATAFAFRPGTDEVLIQNYYNLRMVNRRTGEQRWLHSGAVGGTEATFAPFAWVKGDWLGVDENELWVGDLTPSSRSIRRYNFVNDVWEPPVETSIELPYVIGVFDGLVYYQNLYGDLSVWSYDPTTLTHTPLGVVAYALNGDYDPLTNLLWCYDTIEQSIVALDVATMNEVERFPTTGGHSNHVEMIKPPTMPDRVYYVNGSRAGWCWASGHQINRMTRPGPRTSLAISPDEDIALIDQAGIGLFNGGSLYINEGPDSHTEPYGAHFMRVEIQGGEKVS